MMQFPSYDNGELCIRKSPQYRLGEIASITAHPQVPVTVWGLRSMSSSNFRRHLVQLFAPASKRQTLYMLRWSQKLIVMLPDDYGRRLIQPRVCDDRQLMAYISPVSFALATA